MIFRYAIIFGWCGFTAVAIFAQVEDGSDRAAAAIAEVQEPSQSEAVVAGPGEGLDLPPFRVRRIELESVEGGGPIRGWLAEVDLTWPGLEVVVTDALDETPAADASANVDPAPAPGPSPDPAAGSPAPEAILTPTDQWARQHNLALAVNANYFRILDKTSGESDVLGLSVTDGRVVSPARRFNGVADPILVFSRDGRARVLNPAADFPPDFAFDGVAGIGSSETDPDHGGLLVEAGVGRGTAARVEPMVRHPRTAAGVNQAGDRLVLVVIDGRQPGWSVGITLPELADLLIDHGVHDAINLDGGGSSAFYFNPAALPDTPADQFNFPPILNRPSDGIVRSVANHLGLRLTPHDPTTPPPSAGGR